MLMADLLLLVPGCFGVAAYVVLRLYRDRSAARERQLFNALIVPNLDDARFDPAEIVSLPEPAARYLRRAIAPGTRLARTVDLRLAGEFRDEPTADWRPFTVRLRVSAGRGFLCRSRVGSRSGPDWVGIDYLSGREVRSQRFLGNLLPVVDRDDASTARAAMGQQLLACVWLPSILLPSGGARWTPADDRRASVRVDWPATEPALNLTVDQDGRLGLVTLLRYLPTPAGVDSLVPFGLRVEGSARFDGYTVPSRAVSSWAYGTDEAFESMVLTLESARYY
jgi:hypothetical protein